MKPTNLGALGALAAGFGLVPLATWADTAPADASASQPQLPVVKAKAAAEPTGKDSLQATTTRIGKGQQDVRDVPQSLTVVTEKLIDDRNLDTVKDVLRNTAGITFQAAEGGEEDIRLRGFPLAGTGDLFVDGMRDPAFYDRDTFFFDSVEVLRGSASMLFGRGSTGGAVNQVSKQPVLVDRSEVDVTVASHSSLRAVGDFNLKLGETSALRIGGMRQKADNNGAGSSIDKQGAALAYRWGIGQSDEISVLGTWLDNHNGINYGLPWIRPTAGSEVSATQMLPVSPTTYYGMDSDRSDGTASQFTLTHVHRFGTSAELTTKVRRGLYTRDQRASTIRFCTQSTTTPDCPATVTLDNFGDSTVLRRGTQNKIQDLQTTFVQSDFTARFQAWGLWHDLQTGIDLAKEGKQVYAARSAAQGGVDLTKPTTTAGTPDDGAWVDEDSRVLRRSSAYTSEGGGVYAQDLVTFAEGWKALVGLRYDKLTGDYDATAIPTNAPGPETTTSYRMKVSEWSRRIGLLYQPSERVSYYVSSGTSFNTSGDAYSLSAANVNIPPEESINYELGGRWESASGDVSARAAVFKSTKLHERNTDPDTNLVTLSGKRHATGAELDLAGRITPEWEVYLSYMWLPDAKIDVGVAGSEGQGTRPSLTPRHSGTVWTTYQLTPQVRVGGGLNARSQQTPNRNPGWAAPGYVTADLLAEYAYSERIAFKLNVTNVSDRRVADALYTGHYVPAPGRVVALTGSFKF